LLWQTQQGVQHRETVIKFIEGVVVYKNFKTRQRNTKQHTAKATQSNTPQKQKQRKAKLKTKSKTNK
jgi:hypothetical protein